MRGLRGETDVRRHAVAGLEQEDIAGDQSGGVDRHAGASAHHRGFGRDQVGHRRHGLGGPAFLHEAEDRVDTDDAPRMTPVSTQCPSALVTAAAARRT